MAKTEKGHGNGVFDHKVMRSVPSSIA